MVGDSESNSDIDEPPTRSTKRVKIKSHKRKKRRVETPPVSEEEFDDDHFITSTNQFSDEDSD